MDWIRLLWAGMLLNGSGIVGLLNGAQQSEESLCFSPSGNHRPSRIMAPLRLPVSLALLLAFAGP